MPSLYRHMIETNLIKWMEYMLDAVISQIFMLQPHDLLWNLPKLADYRSMIRIYKRNDKRVASSFRERYNFGNNFDWNARASLLNQFENWYWLAAIIELKCCFDCSEVNNHAFSVDCLVKHPSCDKTNETRQLFSQRQSVFVYMISTQLKCRQNKNQATGWANWSAQN